METSPSAPEHEEVLREIERRRLRSLVGADIAVAEALHAPNFVLVHPGGGVWSRDHYLEGIASGTINYRRFEAISGIDVIIDGTVGVIRYRSAIDIQVAGQQGGTLECWHMDCYQRSSLTEPWRAVWSQATSITAT